MNKVLIGIVAVAVIGGGIFAFTGSSDDEVQNNASNTQQTTAPTTTSETTQASEPESTETTLPATGNGEVVAYSADALANSSTENNLLFFHAAWCTVCNSVERNIEASSIPNDLTIFKVDYDSDEGQALAEKHNIPIQYSMVQVDQAGNELTKWVNQFNDGINEITGNLVQS